MADTSSSSNISALIQVQRAVPRRSNTQLPGTAVGTQNSSADEDAKAIDAAQKFEAMMIHNMLKSMRKTTLVEEKSNARAMYDDMLDEKLATTLMDSGGLGVASQILAQINASKPQGAPGPKASQTDELDKIRELIRPTTEDAQAVNSVRQEAPAVSSGLSVKDALRLKLVSGLMDDAETPSRIQDQNSFLQPLMPHAKRNAQKLGTSPEAVLAIAALETGWGKSVIKNSQGDNSYNLFGIKATSNNQASTQIMTTEYVNGLPIKSKAHFRVYEDSAQAVDSFAQFILENPRYSKALEHASDPERFIQELHNAGYATDPDYANKVISVMKQIENHPLPL